MADNSRIHITPLSVPADLVRTCPGFSLDMGSSAVKITYRTKEDWQYVTDNKEAKLATLHCIHCSRREIEQALQVVKETGHLTRDEQGKCQVVVCGMGGYEYNDIIMDTLDVIITMPFEHPLMMEGLRYLLENCPTSALVYPHCKDEEQEALESAMRRREAIKHLSINKQEEQVLVGQAEFPMNTEKSLAQMVGKDDIYPCLYYLLGSGHGAVVFKDPSLAESSAIIPAAGASTGGKFLLGVGSLLTGCESYEELMELAERGDCTNVDITRDTINKEFQHMPEKVEPDNPYKKFLEAPVKDNDLVFSFGQAMYRKLDEFKREDIAAAWVRSHMINMGSIIYTSARHAGIKRVFVGGSVPAREIVRKELTSAFARFKISYETCQGQPEVAPELYFLRNGGHMSSIGAMIKGANSASK